MWLALASPRDPVVERLQRAPLWVRRAATSLPEAVQPAPKRVVHVRAIDADGRVVHDVDLDDPADRRAFHMVTGVREHEGTVWLGSLHEAAVARLRPDRG